MPPMLTLAVGDSKKLARCLLFCLRNHLANYYPEPELVGLPPAAKPVEDAGPF